MFGFRTYGDVPKIIYSFSILEKYYFIDTGPMDSFLGVPNPHALWQELFFVIELAL